MNKSQIQQYINNFRRHLAPFLRPGIGLMCLIYPALTGGAILVFQLGPEVENDDVYKESSPTLGNALSKIQQRAFAGNLDGISFGGTNVILESNKLIFIKDGNRDEWSDATAEKDARKIVAPSQHGGRK